MSFRPKGEIFNALISQLDSEISRYSRNDSQTKPAKNLVRYSRTNILVATILMILFATQSHAKQKLRTFVYECQSGDSFIVNIKDESVWVFLPKQTVQLPPMPSGSGEKYSDGVITFWNKGEQAVLETPEIFYENCHINRSKSIWEDAKLRGVDFRATGNEPGWFLEISQDTQILFVTDYGQQRYEFTASSSKTDQSARATTYTAEKENQNFAVLLEGRSCLDSMSGQQFETTVTVTLNDKEYRGCGRALH